MRARAPPQPLPASAYHRKLASAALSSWTVAKCHISRDSNIPRASEGRKKSGKLRNSPSALASAADGPLVKLVGGAFKLVSSVGYVQLVGYMVAQDLPERGVEGGIRVELISSKVDPGTQTGRRSGIVTVATASFHAHGACSPGGVRSELKFDIPKDFGEPGGIIVETQLEEPFLLKYLVLKTPHGSNLVFPCNSSVSRQSGQRIFFSNKLRLPVDTPPGLVQPRRKMLAMTRGTGTGTRRTGECVYDFDVYNDIGNPDAHSELLRPVLGGSVLYPYPRRLRTGRAAALAGKHFESVVKCPEDAYLPSDETAVFADGYCAEDSPEAKAHELLPELYRATLSRPWFGSFEELNSLYNEGLELKLDGADSSYLKFQRPQILEEDCKAWMLDTEFARQSLSGLNPLIIERLKAFPPSESSLAESDLEDKLDGLTVAEALERGKLFLLDYHDAFMPYLDKINSQEGIRAYASRTILFLGRDGTLQPAAIELSLPGKGEQQGHASNRVFRPAAPGSIDWLWELAKAHVAANDAAYHQGVSHWLRSHAVLEPIIIAMHRQLSDMHPIKAFLLPHCKCTLSINSEARRILIGAGGIIERTFFTGKYTAEITSMFYKHSWRFDMQGLPADLLKRGMAVEDSNSKHGLKLAIEDYPYAVDGLEIWDAISQWVSEYVDVFYKYDVSVCVDSELQSWWKEAVEVGHADKPEGWPLLDGKQALKQVLTTLLWLASAHHAAVNFGQYAYAGYIPNRPTILHRAVPEVGSDEHRELLSDPERFFCSALATKVEAVTLLGALAVLSGHLPGEDFLGERGAAVEPWSSDDGRVSAAFEAFCRNIEAIEESIQLRNRDQSMKNRRGAPNLPYTLLAPSSPTGITGRGVPTSVSI